MTIKALLSEAVQIQRYFYKESTTKTGQKKIQSLLDQVAITPLPTDDLFLIYSLKNRVTRENINLLVQILERNQASMEVEIPDAWHTEEPDVHRKKMRTYLEVAKSENKIDPYSLTEDILKTDGFSIEETRNKSFGLSKFNQTISEVQGTSAFCKKVIQYTAYDPSVLSLCALRNKKDVNLQVYFTLYFKRIGHAFNIEKLIDLNKKQVCTTGWSESFVAPMIRETFNRFAFLRTDLISPKMYHLINQSSAKAIWHDNLTDANVEEAYNVIHSYPQPYPVSIALGWVWHSTRAIFWKKRQGNEIHYYLGYCNCGADHNNKPGIVILKIRNKDKITCEFIKRIASRLDVTYKEYTSLKKIIDELDAVEVDYIPMKEQKVGNCVYASENAKMLNLFMIAASMESLEVTLSSKPLQGTPLTAKVKEEGKGIYKTFKNFYKEEILADHLIDLRDPTWEVDENYKEAFHSVVASVDAWVLKKAEKDIINIKLYNDVHHYASRILRINSIKNLSQ